VRLDDWEARLDRVLVEGWDRPFEWGRWDCCLFVADAILSTTGEDLAADLRGKYSSLDEARWLLRARFGSASIERSVARLFSRAGLPGCAPGLARRGDPVVVRHERSFQIGVIALDGSVVVNSETKGLVHIPRSLVTRAWHI
jgi:hypothetical protein